MRCNRKMSGLAVTPHKKSSRLALNITEIRQLRRREKAKAETTAPIINTFITH